MVNKTMNFKFTKILTFLLLFLFTFNSFSSFADDVESEALDYETIETSSTNATDLNINARSAIILDRLSKKILYGKNEFSKVKMASTTKIMTASIIIENCDLNKTIEVSKKAAGTGGSRLGLKSGDKITIRDLLYGLMLCSGNDAAVALAENCSGSIKEFSNLMNKKAEELGLNNSHFESPHGLDSDKHYTTAYELAILSDYALKNSTFFNIVGTKTYTITINGYPKNISNTNELLGNLLGVYGIKTGFTNGANRCLVTACKRDNMDIICVVLGCDSKKFRTSDSIRLIDYAFKNFEYVNIEEKINQEFEKWKIENIDSFNIYKGLSSAIEITYSNLETPIIPINKRDIPSLSININVDQNLDAPVYENAIIGEIEVFAGSDYIIKSNVISSNFIPKKNFINYIYEFFKNYSSIVDSIYTHF